MYALTNIFEVVSFSEFRSIYSQPTFYSSVAPYIRLLKMLTSKQYQVTLKQCFFVLWLGKLQ